MRRRRAKEARAVPERGPCLDGRFLIFAGRLLQAGEIIVIGLILGIGHVEPDRVERLLLVHNLAAKLLEAEEKSGYQVAKLLQAL